MPSLFIMAQYLEFGRVGQKALLSLRTTEFKKSKIKKSRQCCLQHYSHWAIRKYQRREEAFASEVLNESKRETVGRQEER